MKGNFDYEQVNSKMEQLNSVFTSFMDRLKTMDTKYTEGIAVDTDSALLGGKASLMKQRWNEFALSFDSLFNKEFTELYSTVQTVATNYKNMEDDVVGIVKQDTADDTSVNVSHYYGGGGGGGAVRVNMIK